MRALYLHCHVPESHVGIVHNVMSLVFWRTQYIPDRQTQHGGFGGGDDVRRGKVRIQSSVVLFLFSPQTNHLSLKTWRGFPLNYLLYCCDK